ncbi:MAG: SAM-dependent methyltransferase, partial [Chlamydiota bacterium]
IGNLWSEAFSKKLPILPLVVNLCHPSPSLGWQNEETISFLQRCKGKFDMIFFLAVLHHVLVTERVPLHEIASLLASLTSDGLVIEFIPKEDPKFQEICRGRDSLFDFYTKETFLQEFSVFFDVQFSQMQKDGNRCLFFMRKKH